MPSSGLAEGPAGEPWSLTVFLLQIILPFHPHGWSVHTSCVKAAVYGWAVSAL